MKILNVMPTELKYVPVLKATRYQHLMERAAAPLNMAVNSSPVYFVIR
jgi:hypothetical protein